MRAERSGVDLVLARWPVVVVPAILALALLSPVLTRGQTVVGYDYGDYNIPQLAQLSRAYRAGRVPGWNPYCGLGQPFACDLAMAPYYPPYLALLALSPVVVLNLLTVVHLIAGYVGAWTLARSRAVSLGGAHLVALGHAFGGISIGYVNNPALLYGTALVPWCALGALRALAPGAPIRRLALAAVPFALAFLAASPESCVMAAVLALALALADGVPPLRAIGRLIAVGVTAAALAAVTLVPFLASAGDTDRSRGIPYDTASAWSERPLELLGAVVPGLLPFASIDPPRSVLERPWHVTPSVGLVTVALAIGGASLAVRRRQARVIAGVALVSLLYALGRFGPLYPVLWQVVTPIRIVRYPAKALAVTALAVALLAGLGLDAVGPPSTRRGRVLAAVVFVVGFASCAGAVLCLASDHTSLALRLGVPTCAALVAAVALRAPSRDRARRVLLATLVLELVLSAHLSLEFAPRALYSLDPPPRFARALAAEEQVRGAPARVNVSWALVVGGSPGVHREVLAPNAGACWEVRCAEGARSYSIAREEALRAAYAARALPNRVYLRAVGTTHAITETPGLPGLEPVDAAGVTVLQRFPDAPPWAATYARVHAAQDLAAALDRVLAPDFSPGRECVVEDAGAAAGIAPIGSAHPARLTASSEDRLELEVEGPAGWLVVREAFARGWTASVDGAPAPVRPADVVFRGVPVPAGRHVVTLSYVGPGRAAGGWISIAAWTAVLIAIAAGGSLRRASPARV